MDSDDERVVITAISCRALSWHYYSLQTKVETDVRNGIKIIILSNVEFITLIELYTIYLTLIIRTIFTVYRYSNEPVTTMHHETTQSYQDCYLNSVPSHPIVSSNQHAVEMQKPTMITRSQGINGMSLNPSTSSRGTTQKTDGRGGGPGSRGGRGRSTKVQEKLSRDGKIFVFI